MGFSIIMLTVQTAGSLVQKMNRLNFQGKGNRNMLTVSKDGSGDCLTINEAVRYWHKLYAENGGKTEPGFGLIYIKKGCYKERLEIRVPHLTLIGEDAKLTKISMGYYARAPHDDGMKRGTFRSYTVLVDAGDVTFRNLTLENTAGTGPDIGQGLALYADGDRLVFENCRFLGCTDTLFTGPLPPKVIKKDGFIGPKEFSPRINGRQWYYRCYIEGDVDFIFGSATAFFEECEIYSKNRGMDLNGFTTAASTAEGQEYGYVFDRCRFTGDCGPKSVYLGRPWRNFAKTVILRSYLGAHIFDEGWDDWSKPEAHGTIYYGEFENYGPGASMDKRPDYVKRLTAEEAEHFNKDAVLAGQDGWQPEPAQEDGRLYSGTTE